MAWVVWRSASHGPDLARALAARVRRGDARGGDPAAPDLRRRDPARLPGPVGLVAASAGRCRARSASAGRRPTPSRSFCTCRRCPVIIGVFARGAAAGAGVHGRHGPLRLDPGHRPDPLGGGDARAARLGRRRGGLPAGPAPPVVAPAGRGADEQVRRPLGTRGLRRHPADRGHRGRAGVRDRRPGRRADQARGGRDGRHRRGHDHRRQPHVQPAALLAGGTGPPAGPRPGLRRDSQRREPVRRRPSTIHETVGQSVPGPAGAWLDQGWYTSARRAPAERRRRHRPA